MLFLTTGKKRYFLNTSPVHADGKPFVTYWNAVASPRLLLR